MDERKGNTPFILDDLAKTVYHSCITLAVYNFAVLELDACFYDVEGIPCYILRNCRRG
jgi:hypothetical protein